MALALLVLSTIQPATAEDRAQVDLYLKAQGERDYDSYRAWRRDQDRVERWEHTDRRPTKGSCTRKKYEGVGKAAWTITGRSNAEREAKLAWERVVRSNEPEMYADAAYAMPPMPKSISCWKVGNDRRCKMEAFACKPAQ